MNQKYYLFLTHKYFCVIARSFSLFLQLTVYGNLGLTGVSATDFVEVDNSSGVVISSLSDTEGCLVRETAMRLQTVTHTTAQVSALMMALYKFN